MDFSDEALETLSQCFLQTLSPHPTPRRQAESSLATFADQPGFALAVLRLVSTPTVDDQIRISAAVHFKNHLKSRWSPSAPEGPIVPDPEKRQIKALIVQFMLSSPPKVQSQLSEALSIISSHDFPKAWPNLLPELVASVRAAMDYRVINGLLGAVNSIFKKFRFAFNTNETRLELKYCLDNFAAPLLEVFLKTARAIVAAVGAGAGAEALRPMFESQRLCCRIFYSLNFIELPEFFEDHMKEWMTEFMVYLTTVYPEAVENSSTMDDVRAAVCENLQLYMEKNEEEFKDYLGDFASSVWKLLMTPSTSASRDRLTITAIKFLTTISTSVHHALFGNPEVLQQICQSIVFPNIRVQEEEEELFMMNYIEFIRRDIEGSDMDTRRRIACEFLKGVAVNYQDQVMAIVSAQVQNMLNAYMMNPMENWKEKDCAIYLVVSLATKKAGGNAEAAHLIDVQSFFNTAIMPELQTQDVNATPMLKAGALKFFTVFRSQIPKQTAHVLLPEVTGFLTSESNVVHSYAANCIDKLLLLKDGGAPRFSSPEISLFLQSLITNLFRALQFPESQENPYVMKCIMRVLGIADIAGEVAAACIGHLSSVLNEVCKNPKDPVFNHYLFEAIAALIGRSCEKNPSLIPVFETSLFPVLESILQNDITEFLPYAFQIFAQLVDSSRPPLSADYMALFQVLLRPEVWTRSANVPALVRLLQAFLKKVPHEMNSNERLEQVFGIFLKLVSASSTQELGFYVLNTVIENMRYDVLAPFFKNIWNTLFTRLQSQRSNVRFIKSLVIFMSLVLVKHGHSALVDSINAVQDNVFKVILQQFWIRNLKLITGFVEMKLTAVASIKLICESSTLFVDCPELWGQMLDSIVTLVSEPEQERVEEETDVPDIGETTGYAASFVRLHNAGRREEDPLKELRDPGEFLVTSLARLSSLTPGKYPAEIEKYLDPGNKEALCDLCKKYNCPIV